MASLEDELIYEIDWRVNEISTLRTLPYTYNFSEFKRKTLEKHTVPALYSLWEGFIVTAFAIYIREINSLQLKYHEIKPCVLTNAIDVDLKLSNGRADFDKKQKFVQMLEKFYNSHVVISTKLPTESNVNLRVLNNIFTRFNLELLPIDPYEKRLGKLLRFRNNIAHGESSLPVDKVIISELTATVIELMHKTTEIILNGYIKKTYLA